MRLRCVHRGRRTVDSATASGRDQLGPIRRYQLTAASADLILRPLSGRGWRQTIFGGTTRDHGACQLGQTQRDPTRARSVASLRILTLAALLAIAVGGCAGIGSASGTFRPTRRGVLTVVTQPLPTVGFWNGTDARPTGGLEFGIARDLAHRFGLRLVVRTEPFARIVAGHLDGADLALSLITPTSTRDQVLDFSSPYINAGLALLVRAGVSIADLQSAQGLRWAVESDTTLQSTIADVIQPDQPPLLFDSRQGVISALRSGRADVALFDLPAAEAIANADPKLQVVAQLADTEPIAAALPQDSQNRQAVSSALRAMLADGTIDRLAQRWLGVSLTASEADVPLLRTSES
jgi:polar amino acid transport system substrate-binding protein